MFNIDNILRFNQHALNLYSKRQEILSSNIANADTPGYTSQDINFNNELKKILQKKNINSKLMALEKTSPNHLDAKYKYMSSLKTFPLVTDIIKLDGNTVDMDRERIEFANNSLKYQSSIAFIKNEIKNIMQVLKG